MQESTLDYKPNSIRGRSAVRQRLVRASDTTSDCSFARSTTGDPMFVTDAGRTSEGRRIFSAPAGLHAHYPLWSPDGRFIHFVLGSLPDKMDIWRG